MEAKTFRDGGQGGGLLVQSKYWGIFYPHSLWKWVQSPVWIWLQECIKGIRYKQVSLSHYSKQKVAKNVDIWSFSPGGRNYESDLGKTNPRGLKSCFIFFFFSQFVLGLKCATLAQIWGGRCFQWMQIESGFIHRLKDSRLGPDWINNGGQIKIFENVVFWNCNIAWSEDITRRWVGDGEC